MGHTTYPCPACFQAQSVTHANGEAVPAGLCAACAQEAAALGLKPEQFAKKAHELRKKAQDAQL